MLSKSNIKLLQSLKHKKFRQKYKIFLVEGHKSVDSLLQQNKFDIDQIYATQSWSHNHGKPAFLDFISIVEQNDLKKLSEHKSAPEVIASVKLPNDAVDISSLSRAIYLDDVQDPGNVGTIIRIADWYGIDTVIRSTGSADFYHPKVIQSTMGSFSNLNLITMSNDEFLGTEDKPPIVIASMEGKPIKELSPMTEFILVMGSEGLGLSQQIIDQADLSITIPGANHRVAESLNVSVATGIICQQLVG